MHLHDYCHTDTANSVPSFWIEDEDERSECAPGQLTAREAQMLSDQQVEVV
jgi:hypothetical protein